MNSNLFRPLLLALAPALALAAASPACAQAIGPGKQAVAPAARAQAAAQAPESGDTTAPEPATSASRRADYIVAIVNQEPITNNEVRARMARLQRQSQAPEGQDIPREQVLELLVSERSQLQYAREQGLQVDESALAQAELSVARQNGLSSIEELHAAIAQEGISPQDFRADLRNQVLLARLRAVEIEPSIHLSDAEVEDYIRRQTGATQQVHQQVNLAMILVAVPENADEAQVGRLQQRAAEAARRARGGTDFAQLVAEISDGPRDNGGAMGLRPLEQYPELFADAARDAPNGQILGPLRSAAGFHVLKLLERRSRSELPQVRIPQTQVRHILLPVAEDENPRIALERAADLKQRLESGRASFGQLARQYSADGSAADGGELGWVPPGQFVPEFEQAMNNLDPGQISDPVVTRFGVHLIQVEDRREQVLEPDEQRQLARNMLREEKAQQAFQTWAQEVRGRAYVEYRDAPT